MNVTQIPTKKYGHKYYKKDRILRDLIWCWISIIVTVMLLTLVSKVHGGDMNNLEFMRNNQFVSVIMIVGSAQLVVAAGFLYLDKIKKTIGGPANTPENYEEWDEFMREQAKLEYCSNTKLWYIIPPIVLVTILLYNFIGIKNNYLWIILAVGVVIWIVTIIVTKVHTKYTCKQNKFFMDIHDKLTDKFKRNSNRNRICKMDLHNKDEECNKDIKNIHESYQQPSPSLPPPPEALPSLPPPPEALPPTPAPTGLWNNAKSPEKNWRMWPTTDMCNKTGCNCLDMEKNWKTCTNKSDVNHKTVMKNCPQSCSNAHWT